eukprot:Plantae.Rhodophyta-Hildenbrandia_rubra.ctg3541.p2 GENE.Plantae.Rhodophyta-Hildenbrandia_rubra.ctg3541~~Plantae.Rhodophyta-Hildenbrandia_rubra.ctg3541.p2  ORF type:complete len:298 (-),score=49.42 Plantae.Rhodophyta-Hildenbrandia_rubra.ctg3541:628-1521(-)
MCCLHSCSNRSSSLHRQLEPHAESSMWNVHDFVKNTCSLWARDVGRNQGATTIYKRLNKQLFQRDALAASSRSLSRWREREMSMPTEEEMKKDPFRSAVKVAYILELPIAVSSEESTGEEIRQSAKEKLRSILMSMIQLLDGILERNCAEGELSVRLKTIEITKNVKYDTAKVLFVVDDGNIFDGKRFVSGFSKSAHEFAALRAMIVELDNKNPSNAVFSSEEGVKIKIGQNARVSQNTEIGQIERANACAAHGNSNLRRRRSAKYEEEEAIQLSPNPSRSLTLSGRIVPLMVFSIL